MERAPFDGILRARCYDELLSELGEPKLQSGGVVQMLEKLLEQFVDERLQLEKVRGYAERGSAVVA